MKILSLHTDYIKFKPLKKAMRSIPDLKEKQKKEQHVEESLVVMVAVEKRDSDVGGVVDKLVEEVEDIAKQVKAKNIVLYPYAHLSSELGSPDVAVKVLNSAAKKLGKKYNVSQAPFGYYKEFELKVKGHPLSELSREIVVEGGEDEEYDSEHLLKEISKSRLDASKLKDNDHRIIGKNMDLFSFSEAAPGMVFFHNKGWIIWKELIKYWREVHQKADYEEIRTPQILDQKLWQISGHWEKYKENIFLTEYDKRTFAVKPMNCPGGMLVYKNKPRSYRDFPLRVAELGTVHRQELSGVLGGMFRVIQFVQDDAHIFCTEDQIEQEILGIMEIIGEIYSKFGLGYRVELSTRPEKRIGSDKIWDKTEKILEELLKKKKVEFKINKGDGAFYGPKIDFHLKDSLDREWQAATIQLDMAMPERFDLEYTDKSNKKKRPIMIHRTVLGGIERFYAILVEHFNGLFPAWLSPVQAKILPMTDKNMERSQEVFSRLKEEGIRVELDDREESMAKKVRDAQMEKVNYMITIGDKEEEKGTIAVRNREGEVKFDVKLKDFISDIKKEIEARK